MIAGTAEEYYQTARRAAPYSIWGVTIYAVPDHPQFNVHVELRLWPEVAANERWRDRVGRAVSDELDLVRAITDTILVTCHRNEDDDE